MKAILLALPLAMLIACGSSDDTTDTTKTPSSPATKADAGGTPPTQGADWKPACTTTTANDKGLGKSCTKGGGECKGNQKAEFCTADAPVGAPPPPFYCSPTCSTDADCGTGGTCCLISKSQGIKSCAPTACGCPPTSP